MDCSIFMSSQTPFSDIPLQNFFSSPFTGYEKNIVGICLSFWAGNFQLDLIQNSRYYLAQKLIKQFVELGALRVYVWVLGQRPSLGAL